MKQVLFLIVSVILLLLLLAPAAGYAQWEENGVGVCTESHDQTYVRAVSDGEGGICIVWTDYRNGNYDIYAQRVDAFGKILWTTNGVAVSVASSNQMYACIASDGAGGSIIAWVDSRNGNFDIYAQRIDAGGTAQWTANGVQVCGAASTQSALQMIADGNGGAIIAWEDERTYGSTGRDIYAQRVNGSGTMLWTTDGVAICAASGDQQAVQMAAHGNGGAWLVWRDGRGANLNIYFQEINAAGNVSWTNGYGICTAIGNQWDPMIIDDGYGGFYAAWCDFRGGGNCDIYAQGMKNSYTFRWTMDGIAVCSATLNQDSPVLVSDGAGGFIAAWRDFRSSVYNVYAQRVAGDGSMLWTANGKAICTYPDSQGEVRIVADGAGGAIISWADYRNGYQDVYCQKINAAGAVQWTVDGIGVCTANMEQTDVWPVADGNGGAIIAWNDYRQGTYQYDIYTQRIERNGYWGYPAPAIHAIRDVPGDQGGRVNLAWDASRIDPWPDLAIDYYSLWRAIDPVQAVSMLRCGARLLGSAADLMAGAGAPAIRVQLVGGATYYWELVATQDANGYEQYARAMPTLFDSTAVSSEQHYFQVCAHGANPGEAWTSPPDSGYSVDNLAPAAPTSLMGEQSMGPDGLVLTWDPNSESDLAGYRVYRGTSEGFVPGSGNLIASPADTTAFDGGWVWNGGYYYKVTAIDIHGNESLWAVLAPGAVTGAGDVPPATFLAQSYPNPFAGSATIAYGISDAGPVSLRVYDIAGRLVRELASGPHEARSYEAVWDGRDSTGHRVASGIYLCRLRAGSFEQTRKMVLVR